MAQGLRISSFRLGLLAKIIGEPRQMQNYIEVLRLLRLGKAGVFEGFLAAALLITKM